MISSSKTFECVMFNVGAIYLYILRSPFKSTFRLSTTRLHPYNIDRNK